jgi:hypothetical protein
MKRAAIACLLAAPVLALGCSGGGSREKTIAGGDSASPTDDAGQASADGSSALDTGSSASDASPGGDGSAATGNNTTPMVVNAGPPGVGSVDVPFINVTICVPGTSNCQTVQYVSVDTGSTGMRVISSALPTSFALPQAKATSGNPLAECYTFGDGYVYGSVRLADITIGGEVAKNVPIQLIGDPAFATVPSDCAATGPAEDTVADFGGNGIIGINQIVADCGSACTGSNPETAAYYDCAGTSCTNTAVAIANQVPNPISLFASDNNGAILQFPSVPAAGEASLTGTLIFGIGTQPNNGLGSAKVLTVDENGNFTTTFNGQTFNTSYIDSGTNTYAFNDSAIPQCTSNQSMGYFCPTSTVNLTAQNQGLNGATSSVSLSVANTDMLFANASFTVFDDLATPGDDNNTFAWGFPFFLGRSVYVANEGATTSGGMGPYFAY